MADRPVDGFGEVDERVGVAVAGEQRDPLGDLVDRSSLGDIDADVGGDVRRVASRGAGCVVDHPALPIQRLEVQSAGHLHASHPAVGQSP